LGESRKQESGEPSSSQQHGERASKSVLGSAPRPLTAPIGPVQERLWRIRIVRLSTLLV